MIEIDENDRQESKIALKLTMKYKFIAAWSSTIVVKQSTLYMEQTEQLPLLS